MWKILFMTVVSGSFGLLSSAGVFTVFVAVGLIPRFAGKTHTAGKVFLYEEMVTLGTILGGFFSIFPEYAQLGTFLHMHFPAAGGVWTGIGTALQICTGLFSGMFVGCLALAIAEMLDSIPIFSRRISFRHGLGLAVLGIALGKFCGSVFYFWSELHRVVQ